MLEAHGFDQQTFDKLRERLRRGEATAAHNRVRGDVQPPQPGDVVPLSPPGTPERARLDGIGLAALSEGTVGAVILAGGMATRFGGVVKAGVPALDGLSFLDLKLRDVSRRAEQAGHRLPVFLMASFATEAEVRRLGAAASSERVPVETFTQYVSLRLTPEAALFEDGAGRPSPYAPGHGDLTFALRRSGMLQRFVAAGGRTLMMSNVDNVTATLDPAVIGAHLLSGAAVTVENAPKEPGDRGGAPARVDGRLQIVESFRFPDDFDQDRIPVFNTNTLVLDAQTLDRDFPLSWFAVEKSVDDRPAIQFERLVGELTAFLPSHFIEVARRGPDARFQPAKDPAELARRQPEIRAALGARGVL